MRSIAKLSVSIGTRRSACRCFVNVGSPLIVAGIRVAHIVESIAAKERRIFPESPLGKALQRIRDENASQKSGQGKKPIRPCARMNQGRRALFPNLFMLRAIRKIERLPKKEDYRADRNPWGRGAGKQNADAPGRDVGILRHARRFRATSCAEPPRFRARGLRFSDVQALGGPFRPSRSIRACGFPMRRGAREDRVP